VRVRSLVVAAALLTMTADALRAQRHPQAEAMTARARAALAPLAGLVGTWDGEARVSIGPNQWLKVNQHEQVEWHSMGTVLLIRGTGRSAEGTNKGEIVFEATAVIWYDQQQRRPAMRTFVDGNMTDAEIEVKPDTIVWGFPVQGARIRYTIAFSGGKWHEVGHYVREGAAPVETIDMRLVRKAP
jgi:hypothetical protein